MQRQGARKQRWQEPIDSSKSVHNGSSLHQVLVRMSPIVRPTSLCVKSNAVGDWPDAVTYSNGGSLFVTFWITSWMLTCLTYSFAGASPVSYPSARSNVV